MKKASNADFQGGPLKSRLIEVALSEGRYQPGDEVEVVVGLGPGFESTRVDWLLAQACGEVLGLHGARLDRDKLSFRSPEEASRPSIASTHGYVPAEQRLSSSSALLFSTSPEILAVQIDPKESRQAVFHFTLPHLLPPSFTGKYTIVRYYIIVAASANSTVFESKTPLRVTCERGGLKCVGRAVRCIPRRDSIFGSYDLVEDRLLTWAARKEAAAELESSTATFGKKHFSISFNKAPVGEISVSGRWNLSERLLYVDLDSPMTISVRFSTTKGSIPTEHLRVRLVRTERSGDELVGVHRIAVSECVLPSVHECGLTSSTVPLYIPVEESPSFTLPGAVKVSHQIVFDFFVLDGDDLTRVTWTLNCRIVDEPTREDHSAETPITTPLPFQPSEGGDERPGSLLMKEARVVRKGRKDAQATIDCILSTAEDSVLEGDQILHRTMRV